MTKAVSIPYTLHPTPYTRAHRYTVQENPYSNTMREKRMLCLIKLQVLTN